MPDRFARTAEQVAARQDERAAALAGVVHTFVLAHGDERAIDVGTGAGALALALAPIVREVVGVDRVPELLELARERAADHRNVTFVEGDAEHLPFEDGSFDLACTLRTLHPKRTPRPSQQRRKLPPTNPPRKSPPATPRPLFVSASI